MKWFREHEIPGGQNWTRIRTELSILDVVLEHAIRGKAADPQKKSVNPLQSVVLESGDLLEQLTSPQQSPGMDRRLTNKIRDKEEEIEQEALGSSRLGYLTATLGLQRFEERTIILALAPELDAKYSEIYAYLQDSVMRVRPTIDLALQLFSTHSEDRVAFSAGSPLTRGRLLLEHAPHEIDWPMSQRTLSLDDRVLGFLLESPNIDYEIETWVTLLPLPKNPPRAPVRREILDRTTEMARECYGEGEAKQRPVFHLIGRTGSGRRALAEVACREAGIPLLVADMRAAGRACDKAESMWRLGRESLLQNSAVLVENFDHLLEEESERALTAFLQTVEDFGSPMVFLSGTQEWRPPGMSPERPFVSISIPGPTSRERIALWNEHLGLQQHVLKANEIAAIASNFDFTDGQIREAVESARSTAFWETRANYVLDASMVRAACRKQALPKLGNLARRIERNQSWSALKLPEPQLEQLHEIVAHLKHSAEVFGTWGFAREFQYGLGLAACFEGVSGTGKTMAAGILAAEVGLDLITTDLSAIQSKYIGETNKHLKRLFEEVQRANAILFIDEADALFGKRSEVKDSHDRYANSEVAFLLQQIEEFTGTVILATNMKQNMDEAFLRRMRFVVHFPFPDESIRLEIWKDIFPTDAPIDPNLNLPWLARRLKIAGGNIKNIAIRAAFMAADRSLPDERVIDMSAIIEAAKREHDKMGTTFLPAEFEGWRKVEMTA
jgi:hypothetical protein